MKKQRRIINKENDEMKSLGSELGSFGLEPPRIYRPEQREKIQQTGKQTISNIKKKATKPQPKKQPTREEQIKKRKQKKKLRLVVSIVCTVIALVIMVVILSLTVFFKIDTITIQGNKKYTTAEINAVLPIEKQKNLFLCDTNSASQKLEKNLPYIYSADIKRKLPTKIIVNITETKTIYSVKNADESYTLLDDNFKVLDLAVKKPPKNSVIISKVAFKKKALGEVAEFSSKNANANLPVMIDTIKKLKLDKITEIYCVDKNNNYMVYDNRITIKLGPVTDLENKLYSAYTALEKINETNPQASGEITSMGGKQIYFTENK